MSPNHPSKPVDSQHGRPFYAFILGDEQHQPHLWHDFGLTEANTACNRYLGGKHPWMPTVRHVRSTWEKTLEAHLALYEHFMGTDGTHCVLLSESCMPLVNDATVSATLRPGISYFARLQDPCPFVRHRKRAVPRAELQGKVFANFALAHEQWTALSREHVALVLAHAAWLRKHFARSFADNECYSGSLLNLLGERPRMADIGHHHARWRAHGRHPVTYSSITIPMMRQWRSEGALFARKINAATFVERDTLNHAT